MKAVQKHKIPGLSPSPAQAEFDHPSEPTKDLRLYVWLDSKEVVFFQSLLDAQEGLGRCRTEKSENQRSLLFIMTPESNYAEITDFLRQFQKEYGVALDIV